MLEKPSLKDERIIARLERVYGLQVAELTFLPLGADMNTAVYRAVAEDETPYFVKLRRGNFAEASVTVPNFLSGLGIEQIIPPLPTQKGRLWTSLAPYSVILYPFVEGHNGFEVKLSDRQRIAFGKALKRFHTADIPTALTNDVRREIFSPHWRDTVKTFLAQIESETFKDPIAADLATFLKTKRSETLELVERTERYASALKTQSLDFILCHADIHAWNLLIDGNGSLYIVDWDTLIRAPKERDLMFIGCGLGGIGHTLQEEETLFYQGYGQTQINPTALAYFRYERIIEDIAVYCEQIFYSRGDEDRQQGLEFLKSNFLPDGTIALAYQLDKV